MQNYFEIYADILLEDCLKIKKGEPLYIDGPMECYSFMRILVAKAYKLGVKDIKLNLSDAYIKHSELTNLSLDELKENGNWTGKIMEEYAKKNATFLMLKTEYPGLMSDVDTNILTELQLKMNQESATFDEKRGKNELSWTIAAVATQDWADKIFPNEEDNLNKLWQTIFDICLITQDNPRKKIREKIAKSRKRAEALNNLHLKSLHYKNSLGTDFTIKLPENYRKKFQNMLMILLCMLLKLSMFFQLRIYQSLNLMIKSFLNIMKIFSKKNIIVLKQEEEY